MIDRAFLGRAMIELRKGRFSQRKAAQKANVPVGTWNQWEKGKRLPRASQLEKILLALGCTEDDLRAVVWRLQGEDFALKGTELSPIAARILADSQEKKGPQDLDDYEDVDPRARTILIRFRARLNALEAEFDALVLALKQEP